LTKKADFADYGIYNPSASLIESSNFKLYGLAKYGGVNSLGAIFEYDIQNSIFTKKLDFSGQNGANPYFNSIILNLLNPTKLIKKEGTNATNIYPNPANKYVVISDLDVIESFEIRTLTGQILVNQEIKSKQYSINLDFINNGVYILKIVKKDKYETSFKLVVQN
jgi:hypothetical protein